MARNYAVTELVEHQRAASPDYHSPVQRRLQWGENGDMSMLPLYLRQESVCSLLGKRVEIHLPKPDQTELLALWRHLDPDLNALFLRYEADIAANRVNTSITVWTPCDGGPPLTSLQESMRLAPSFQGQQFDRAYRNNLYLRSASREEKLKSCNCCFKAVHPVLGEVYGIVDSFLLLRAYPHDDAPVEVFLKAAAWCKILAPDPNNELKQCQQFLESPPEPGDLAFFASSYCPLAD